MTLSHKFGHPFTLLRPASVSFLQILYLTPSFLSYSDCGVLWGGGSRHKGNEITVHSCSFTQTPFLHMGP